MVNDGGVERGKTTQWEVTAAAKTGSRGKHRTFVWISKNHLVSHEDWLWVGNSEGS